VKEYLDFDLEIEKSESGYRARVLNSPTGQATETFDLPFSDLEVDNFVLRLGRPRRGVRRLESTEMTAAKEFGGRLFDSVFEGAILGVLQSSLNEASQRDAGLRIRLRLSGTPELVDLPWEYLYDSSLNRFLSLSVDTPVIRYLDLPGRIEPLAVTPPLRVLVMISSPRDYPTLDTEAEWAKLKEAVADLEEQGWLVLDRLEQPTLAALQHQLRRKNYHIFHFVGHGGFDESAEDGVLVLEDEEGHSRQVSGQYLGMLLHDEKTLRLAILNACEGGRTSRSDPFAGVGQSLLQQGIPAVIAMQFEISDEAAITMAHEFYCALADGYPVDAALSEARKGIFAEDYDVEWGTPVLYLRASDGRIFEVEKDGTLAPISRRQREAMPAEPVAPPIAVPEPAPSPVPEPEPAGASAGRRTPWVVIGAVVALLVVGALAFLLSRGGVLGGGAGQATLGPTSSVPEIAVVDEPTSEPTEAPTHTPEPTATATPRPAATATTEPPTPTSPPPPTSEPTPEPAPVAAAADFGGRLAIPLKQGFEQKVYVTGLDGQGVNGPSPVSLAGSQPMFSRDGARLIVNGTASDLSGAFLVDPGGQTPQVLIDRDSAHWPALSPDGQEILFADVSLNNILMSWKSDGSVSEVQANNTPIIVRSLLWSDDNRIVFHSCASWLGQPGDCGIWISDPANLDPVRILVGNEAWPMDAGNRLLAYMSAQDGDWDIYTVPLGGGEPENLTDNEAQDGLAAIAPDGRSIAYVSNESGPWAVWTITLGSKEKQHRFDINPERGVVDLDAWSSERMSWGR
jgi:hypothetical protein